MTKDFYEIKKSSDYHSSALVRELHDILFSFCPKRHAKECQIMHCINHNALSLLFQIVHSGLDQS